MENHHSVDAYYPIGNVGPVQPYDSRAVPMVPQSRAMMQPQYSFRHNYSTAASSISTLAHSNPQQNPFSYNPHSNGSINLLVPVPQFGVNYGQQRRHGLRLTQPELGAQGMAYEQESLQGYIADIDSQSPRIKPEQQHWSQATPSPTLKATTTKHQTTPSPSKSESDLSMITEGVDTLMKAIQSKTAGEDKLPSKRESHDSANTHNMSRDYKKRFACTIENCDKTFSQKTHLDIHERKHTGFKPYLCPAPGCGRQFSQKGNLRTHQRRHTGERPYQCQQCGKSFAQSGNVRAHMETHTKTKIFPCRLGTCIKEFTQLGNLKHHQNKFHEPEIRALTAKFASIENGDLIDAADKQLWDYFASLYKNSNKGIKGRGKDRKVLQTGVAALPRPPVRGTHRHGRMAFPGTVRGNNVSVMPNSGMMASHGMQEGHYDMFDPGEGSQSSHSTTDGSMYGDVPSDSYDDNGRSHDLAFGDRIY